MITGTYASYQHGLEHGRLDERQRIIKVIENIPGLHPVAIAMLIAEITREKREEGQER